MQKKLLLSLLTSVVVVLLGLPLKAQVNIGSTSAPHSFSILELTTNLKEAGLRMPQLSTTERNQLDVSSNEAKGLWIYNTDTHCLEFWNGKNWISLCSDVLVAPVSVTLSPAMSNVVFGTPVHLIATIDPVTAVQYEWERSSDGADWTIVSGESASTLSVAPDFTGDFYYRVTAFNSAGSAISNTAQITVTLPDGGGTNPNIQMYAGAFWRAGERGERIIQFGVGNINNPTEVSAGLTSSNSGAWTASVAWYDSQWDPETDGVELLANSAPVNLSSLPADAESSPVNGSRTISGSVTEGGTISFRIGLDKHFENYDANTNPARYAVVMLTYNDGNKWTKFFIRQGEGADYVMRPGDAGTGVPAGRPDAVKFSPYNLTDPNGATTNSWNKATALPVKGAVFTNYPTKAGYFFIYNATTPIDPDISATAVSAGNIGSWSQNIGTSGGSYWSTTWETCPGTFRRPTDGANNTTTFGNGVVAGSEIRQSLWENPPATNSVISYSVSFNSIWGYYADGYFDRKPLMDATSMSLTALNTAMDILVSAVAYGTIDVAYEGRLFFNPTTNASLFFPAGGYRAPNTGQLTGAGARARYWTSSSSNSGSKPGNDAWFMYIYSYTDGTITKLNYDEETGSPYFPDASRSSGAFVRCVQP